MNQVTSVVREYRRDVYVPLTDSALPYLPSTNVTTTTSLAKLNRILSRHLPRTPRSLVRLLPQLE